MNAVLRAVPAAGSVPSGWAAGLDTSGYDRRVELTDPEARALAELGVAGLRRSRARGAQQQAPWWAALTRLVEPLDTARAGLHHDNVARYRRASRDAAGLILAHCAQTGRSYWGWTGWEWARLCGASAEEFLAARAVPREVSVRPFLIALSWLISGFSDLQHLGTFNRL
ncbi:MAG: site-specific integrase, partial [Actinomycetota bacterium]|nr:site-specific integrase [Actinomycetota bacterium]